jgi:homocysteine S-methyltransferase
MNIKYPLLIDGGLSNVLEKQGCDLNDKLWSAKLLKSNPEAIIQAHLAYLNAGAQCITTSSYQASVPGFMALGHDQATAENYLIKSVDLAVEAVNRFEAKGTQPIIAASIGPYGAYLADGSEYRGNYGVSDEVLHAFHYDRIQLLNNTKADLFACETIPSFQEAKVLSTILKETEKSAWISFSCKDEAHLNDETPITTAVELFIDHPTVFAIGVNCTPPQYISDLIKTIKSKAGSKRVVMYPNSGEVYNATNKTWSSLLNADSCVTMSKEWMELGADIIGGCCRIGPEQIKQIAAVLVGVDTAQ